MATINVSIYYDPLVQKIIKICKTDKKLRRAFKTLIDKNKFVVAGPSNDKLTVTIHLTDEALEIYYRHKGV